MKRPEPWDAAQFPPRRPVTQWGFCFAAPADLGRQLEAKKRKSSEAAKHQQNKNDYQNEPQNARGAIAPAGVVRPDSGKGSQAEKDHQDQQN
jgi:hypothetical protein